MNWKQLISGFWIVAFFGVMAFNISVTSYYFWNQEDIALEQCENLDRGITQCQGMCYLADQVVESTSASHDMEATFQVPGQMSFLFYFVQEPDNDPSFEELQTLNFAVIENAALDGYSELILPPPIG